MFWRGITSMLKSVDSAKGDDSQEDLREYESVLLEMNLALFLQSIVPYFFHWWKVG
jgi:hypothetical protein